MITRRGQAALEFLMTYGWAFLVMIAVIAGIVALDPLGAAQTNINLCQISQPWSCSSDALVLDSANNNLQFRMSNQGRDTLTVSNFTVSDTNTSTCNVAGTDVASGSTQNIQPDDTITVNCSSMGDTISGSFVSGDQYEFDSEISYYAADVGSDYERTTEGTIRVVAN